MGLFAPQFYGGDIFQISYEIEMRVKSHLSINRNGVVFHSPILVNEVKVTDSDHNGHNKGISEMPLPYIQMGLKFGYANYTYLNF